MKTKSKMIIMALLICVLLTANMTSVFAASTVCAGDAGLYGTGVPTKIWDISKKGQHAFSGISLTKNLYTDYLYTGKASYTITITTPNAKIAAFKLPIIKTLTVNVYQKTSNGKKLLATKKIPYGTKNYKFVVSKLLKSDNIYLEFCAPCNYKGTIS